MWKLKTKNFHFVTSNVDKICFIHKMREVTNVRVILRYRQNGDNIKIRSNEQVYNNSWKVGLRIDYVNAYRNTISYFLSITDWKYLDTNCVCENQI